VIGTRLPSSPIIRPLKDPSPINDTGGENGDICEDLPRVKGKVYNGKDSRVLTAQSVSIRNSYYFRNSGIILRQDVPFLQANLAWKFTYQCPDVDDALAPEDQVSPLDVMFMAMLNRLISIIFLVSSILLPISAI